jgi:hypothetical protein
MSENKGWFEIFRRIIGHVDLEKWIESTSRLFTKRPRRYLWVFLTFALFCVWGGFRNYLFTATHSSEILGEVTFNQEGAHFSAKALLTSIWALLFSWGTAKFIISAILSFTICAADSSFTTKRIKEMLYFTADDNLNTLILVLSQCGVARAYRTETELQTTKQHYASDIRASAAASKTIRIMSIAGYEYIGAGTDSLLYTLINNDPEINAEFIFLDPIKGGNVLADRVARLKRRSPTLTVEKIKGDMQETMRLLEGLRPGRRGDFSVWQCECQTVFRLIILDDCLFVSAYKSDAHGHESPMFKINKFDQTGKMMTDWFDAFEQIYTLIKSKSARVI